LAEPSRSAKIASTTHENRWIPYDFQALVAIGGIVMPINVDLRAAGQTKHEIRSNHRAAGTLTAEGCERG
jgi:hypothetical protein